MYENRVHFKFLFGPIYLSPSSPSDTLKIVSFCVREKKSPLISREDLSRLSHTELYTLHLWILIQRNRKIYRP